MAQSVINLQFIDCKDSFYLDGPLDIRLSSKGWPTLKDLINLIRFYERPQPPAQTLTSA